ncbi:hypothetical protein ASF43_08705 [Pseudorhodoferax sp. Leaf267]|nr:hypothetical protein ASF43_08705 [Pseudorhodoferax sp. Leaf267]
MRLLAAAPGIRTHLGLLTWLRSVDMQQILPHDILLAAWGNLRGGAFEFDIVSDLPGVRTSAVEADKLQAPTRQLFAHWQDHGEQPCTVAGDVLQGALASLALASRSMLVHGLRDRRTGQDCMYVLVSPAAGHGAETAGALAALLPHIDLGFRQVATLPRRSARPTVQPYHEHATAMPRMQPEQITVPATSGQFNTPAMTERELQIMRWVEMGKTNHEIGAILDISAFTVKNHLQRIFKKLDVYSRAQAVSRFKDSMLHG